MIAATWSFSSSFFAFSAKVGQSLAPSSWMNLIWRPSTPPMALIWSIASFSASWAPVSLIAIVPVREWRIPTVTVSSVTARPVVFTFDVGGPAAILSAIVTDNATPMAATTARRHWFTFHRFFICNPFSIVG
jgi:hypothetical protein